MFPKSVTQKVLLDTKTKRNDIKFGAPNQTFEGFKHYQAKIQDATRWQKPAQTQSLNWAQKPLTDIKGK